MEVQIPIIWKIFKKSEKYTQIYSSNLTYVQYISFVSIYKYKGIVKNEKKNWIFSKFQVYDKNC